MRTTGRPAVASGGFASSRRGRIATLAATTAFALIGLASAFAAPSMAAAPMFNGGTFPNHFTMTGGQITFATVAGDSNVICKEISGGSGNITTAGSGTFEAQLVGCRLGLLSCQAEAGGNARFEGGIDLVLAEAGVASAVFTMNEITFRCEYGATKHTIKERGAVIGTITPANTETKSFSVTFPVSGGYNKYHECTVGLPCGGGTKDIRVESNRDERFWEPGRLETTLNLTTEQSTKIETRAYFTGALPNHFALTTGAITFATPNGGGNVICKEMTGGSGNLTSGVNGNFTIELGSCKTALTTPCEALGGGKPKFEGTMELVRTSNQIGVVLSMKEIAFHCQSTSINRTTRYRGYIVGLISPVNTLTTAYTLSFTSSGGYNTYHECEVGLLCGKDLRIEAEREVGFWEPGRLESSLAMTTEHSTRILN